MHNRRLFDKLQELVDVYDLPRVVQTLRQVAKVWEKTEYKRRRGHPKKWRDADLMNIWVIIEAQCFRRGMKVRTTLKAIFAELNGKPWVLGEPFNLSIANIETARRLHSRGQALMREWLHDGDPRYDRWARALGFAKEPIKK